MQIKSKIVIIIKINYFLDYKKTLLIASQEGCVIRMFFVCKALKEGKNVYAVRWYSEEDYRNLDRASEPKKYHTVEEAALELKKISKEKFNEDLTQEEAIKRIISSANADWIVFPDKSVLQLKTY